MVAGNDYLKPHFSTPDSFTESIDNTGGKALRSTEPPACAYAESLQVHEVIRYISNTHSKLSSSKIISCAFCSCQKKLKCTSRTQVIHENCSVCFKSTLVVPTVCGTVPQKPQSFLNLGNSVNFTKTTKCSPDHHTCYIVKIRTRVQITIPSSLLVKASIIALNTSPCSPCFCTSSEENHTQCIYVQGCKHTHSYTLRCTHVYTHIQ